MATSYKVRGSGKEKYVMWEFCDVITLPFVEITKVAQIEFPDVSFEDLEIQIVAEKGKENEEAHGNVSLQRK